MPIDPNTVLLIVKEGIPLITELIKHLSENQSKIQEILQKIDQVFLRDLNSALDAIKDASSTDNIDVKKRLLDYAENKLRTCAGENLHSKIGDLSSAYYVGLSHYGLFTIFKLRGEDELAVRHVLRTFVSDPRSAREIHFPDVYRNIFVAKCADENIWYHQRLDGINKDNFANRVLKNQALIVGKGVGTAALGIIAIFAPRGIQHAGPAFKEAVKSFDEFGEITPEKYRIEMREKAKGEYEDKIDKKCQTAAVEMLL